MEEGAPAVSEAPPQRCLPHKAKSTRILENIVRIKVLTGSVSPIWIASARDSPPYPDPWADLESRSPLRGPRNYPIIVQGTIVGVLLSRSSQGSG